MGLFDDDDLLPEKPKFRLSGEEIFILCLGIFGIAISPSEGVIWFIIGIILLGSVIKMAKDNYDQKMYEYTWAMSNPDSYKNRKKNIYTPGSDFTYYQAPKCPYCQSMNLSKISTTKKVAKVAAFGIYGMDDTGKTYKCNNCGCKF